MSAIEKQLDGTILWAGKIQRNLQKLLDAHGDCVHFRPSSRGFSMIGLLADRPQRGKGGFGERDLALVQENFEDLFKTHCSGTIHHGRRTGEKALQSFLICESYRNGRRLESLNIASRKTSDPVDLRFITDEISLPLANGKKIVCDLLALRCDAGRSTPVLIELKDRRMQRRLVAQVDVYADLIDQHRGHYERLFAALLGKPVQFDKWPTEKWIVWPEVGPGQRDPREDELASKGIRVVGYQERDGRFILTVGQATTLKSGLSPA